jgi:hypothetical protein
MYASCRMSASVSTCRTILIVHIILVIHFLVLKQEMQSVSSFILKCEHLFCRLFVLFSDGKW